MWWQKFTEFTFQNHDYTDTLNISSQQNLNLKAFNTFCQQIDTPFPYDTPIHPSKNSTNTTGCNINFTKFPQVRISVKTF